MSPIGERAFDMKVSLTPKTTEFFVLFASAGGNALEVAYLRRLLPPEALESAPI